MLIEIAKWVLYVAIVLFIVVMIIKEILKQIKK